ncbi:hypothetical protein ELE36_08610 [Pseudolysobacter antarcticus]|uniref:Right-handed parallel beta-helix repeat-containing protein n=1 Tax=Pseudolysobacter antarcticus TaxID=2511995 RepID=A0A411HIU8_9GAMM|nr:choice-of-anchor Q domain-containing protein [Pseudolysobacter antarcticus]QBB70423.1 hypothetical protein ELE36_08610 [Pseudolysobacter antarcticus]
MSIAATLTSARRKPLAICIAALFALSATPAIANTINVSNCADNGAGSLRSAIASAISGDTINMTGLVCSSISLTTGAIHILQSDLTVTGPTNNIVIDHFYASPSDRILVHNGAGTLTLNNLDIRHGYASTTNGTILGGCIYSAGTVALTNSRVTSCRVGATGSSSNKTKGGGIFAKKDIKLSNSQVSFNTAYANPGFSYGGGAFSDGTFEADSSIVTYNIAQGSDVVGPRGYGGGLFLRQGSTISGSTISNNYANANAGGILFLNNAINTISNSTISNNSAGGGAGGILAVDGSLYLNQTTVAFNIDNGGQLAGKQLSAGVTALALSEQVSVHLQSALISNNTRNSTSPPMPTDFAAIDGSTPLEIVTVTGAKNLIYSHVGNVPNDTISACPLLGPLKNNGGPTRTHALLSRSPAIDQGSASQSFDQRGSPFVRQSNSVADIGAYEVQKNDVIFNTTFENCP